MSRHDAPDLKLERPGGGTILARNLDGLREERGWSKAKARRVSMRASGLPVPQ